MKPGTSLRVDSYPGSFHALAYDELLDQNAGYWLDAGSRPPMIRSISAKEGSSRPAFDDSSRCVNRDQSATTRSFSPRNGDAKAHQPDLSAVNS